MGVSSRLNELIGEKASVVLPMDGYHLSRAELRRLGSSGAIRPVGGVWDDKWYVDVSDGEVLRDRLVDRHLETWTEEKTKIWGSAGRGGARAKAEANDLKNAAWIERRSKKFADLIVRND